VVAPNPASSEEMKLRSFMQVHRFVASNWFPDQRKTG